ncbi:hypothetical protein TGCAST_388970 [Toxoplasma gondii CAST]|uniref:Uncharacterized protein n=1 Tax=Toxoplasma gondii CAST TaxID=943122 RepID=A0A425HSI5_TOXGO|nr:hypothetical protein TGCAST_388970 [Toxoplasma gondii CAST]
MTCKDQLQFLLLQDAPDSVAAPPGLDRESRRMQVGDIHAQQLGLCESKGIKQTEQKQILKGKRRKKRDVPEMAVIQPQGTQSRRDKKSRMKTTTMEDLDA